jgi:hypothetical protein
MRKRSGKKTYIYWILKSTAWEISFLFKDTPSRRTYVCLAIDHVKK